VVEKSDEAGSPRLDCGLRGEKWNKEPSWAPLGAAMVGMLSNVDKGEAWAPENCDRIDWVDTGEEDGLAKPLSPPSKSMSRLLTSKDVGVW